MAPTEQPNSDSELNAEESINNIDDTAAAHSNTEQINSNAIEPTTSNSGIEPENASVNNADAQSTGDGDLQPSSSTSDTIASQPSAFPGHVLKPGRKSFFSTNQMDYYTQALQPTQPGLFFTVFYSFENNFSSSVLNTLNDIK